MVESTRIVRCVVDSTNWIVRFARQKKSHKKANKEGRKSGQIDSIRVDLTRIVRCVVDSTNWIVRFARHLEKITQEGEKGG